MGIIWGFNDGGGGCYALIGDRITWLIYGMIKNLRRISTTR